MAAIYQWFETNIQELTTTLYPIEVVEGMQFSVEMTEGSMRQASFDHMSVGHDAVSGTLVQVYQEDGPYDDHMMMDHDAVSGVLVQVYLSDGPYDDHMSVSHDAVSGVLANGLIYALMPDEGMMFGLSLTDASMTPV